MILLLQVGGSVPAKDFRFNIKGSAINSIFYFTEALFG